MAGDPNTTIVVACLIIMDISWTALYFYNALRSDDQVEAQRRLFYLTNSLALPTVYMMLFCNSAGFERVRVRRELNNGMYSPSAYLLVTTSIQLPISYCVASVGVLITFVWGDLHAWGSFGFSMLAMGATLFWYLNLAQICGWVFGHLIGTLIFMGIWIVTFRACTLACVPAYPHVPPSLLPRSSPPPL